MKLNIGCGTDRLNGYINIDARHDVGADLVHDITLPFPYGDQSVTEIMAQDIFEHLTLVQQKELLRELHRLLEDGGKLWLRVPNIEDIWNRFLTDPDTRNLFLYGDTSESGVWGAHKSGHTLLSLCTLVEKQGFSLIKYRAVNTNFEIEFKKTNLPSLSGVVFINQSLGMGGAEKFNLQLLTWLKRQNVPVTAWVAKSDFQMLLQNEAIPAKKIPLLIDLIGDLKGFLKGIVLLPFGIFYYTYLVFKTRRLGTYYLTGYIEKILVTPIAKLLGLPVVWVEFGPLGEIFSKFFGIPKFLYRLVSQLPDFVIEPSQNTFKHNLNLTNISRARTAIIPCAIEPLTQTTISKIPSSVYSVSRLEQGKGQDLLLAAWPKVLASCPKARLFIVGEGHFLISLKKQVQKLGIASSVDFLGRVGDMSKSIAPFDIGVFPSVWPLEGFGLVILEAMSQGKPIICSNFGPYPEIVDSACSILIDPHDTLALSNSIITLLKDKKLAKKLAQEARSRFNNQFTWDKIGPRYLDLLIEAQVRSITRGRLSG